jgi:hypothetical protein
MQQANASDRQRICQHCGHVSTPDAPVVDWPVWIGGEGLSSRRWCQNPSECNARFDRANGLRLQEAC